MNKTTFKHVFGIGPVGLLATLPIWGFVLIIEKALSLPKMVIHPILRLGLIVMFLTDSVYLIAGGLYAFFKNGAGKKLVETGPYQYVRHPMYSAIVYSISGGLAVGLLSWGLLFAVLPISLLWSWLISYEEINLEEQFGQKYRKYREKTGVFFPNFKALSRDFEKSR